MKKQDILALLLCLSPLYGHAQRAVFLSEVSSPFGGTTGKIVELYNASDEPADIGKCVIHVSSGTSFDYTIPQGKTIAPKSTFTMVFSPNNVAAIKKAYPELATAGNVIFSARAYPSGPVYLRDSQGKTLDYVYAADFRRVSVILDSDGYLAGNSTSYYGCFSGDYETSFSPTLLTADVKIKRKQALLYEYDNSGNRVLRKPNTIYIHNNSTVQTQSFTHDEEEDNFAEMELPGGERTLSVYPNPVRGNLNIQATGEGSTYTYRMYNVNGMQLLDGDIASEGEHTVPMDDFRSGTYILVIESGDKKETFKIIKE